MIQMNHKDRCDRLLLATARNLGASLLTADEVLLAYRHVDRVDARQ
jgi:PIN domain nuclease of toxin-antitoxin system